MSANVISHQEPRRKRSSARAWTSWRIGVLIVTAAGIVAASWLAPGRNQASITPPRAPQIAQPALSPSLPGLATIDASADLAGAPPVHAARSTRRAVAPLAAAAANEPPGYEILSAAELARISQARD